MKTELRAAPDASLSWYQELFRFSSRNGRSTSSAGAFMRPSEWILANFDLVVAKSPNGFRTWYESIASLIVPVDAPGSTSANLKSLPFQRCLRPIFPLDADVPSPFSSS